jgi:hypothetical protein
MPKIRRRNLPQPLVDHLWHRVRDRQISAEQLTLLVNWIDTNPEVPAGPWFKRFPEIFVCGEGELIKTFLRVGQLPFGQELQ